MSQFNSLNKAITSQTILRLTLLLLLLYGSSETKLETCLVLLCGALLVSPRLLLQPQIWIVICGVVWWLNAVNWLWIDNHKFLISYWCLVCTLAVNNKTEMMTILAHNARYLIGLTFGFATIWKILGGEYLSGEFWHYTFLTETRIEIVAHWLGNLNRDTINQNYLLSDLLKNYLQPGIKATLVTSDRLEFLAIIASCWTIVIEGLIAIAYLGNTWLTRYRDYLLILFLVTTYFLLPVLGFAYVLVIMGMSQCQSPFLRPIYLILLILLPLPRLWP